ncbi:phosphotransferase [Microbacteriaceae bacterium VKM Ac-2855]|nr:phosphotransferase [Microbacteriaceae bacterium VKM Ac-2855]
MNATEVLASATRRARIEFDIEPDGAPVAGWKGRTLSGPFARADEIVWLRLVLAPIALARGMWWTGTADSAVVRGLPKPELLDLREWDATDLAGYRIRAELMTRLPGRALSPTPELAPDAEVDPRLWLRLAPALRTLADVTTERDSTVPAMVDRLVHSFFGDRFPRASSHWTTAHGDLHPANLLDDPLGIVDWEGWGRAPAHFDLATLYVHALAAPDARRSLLDVFGDELHSDAARPALAFVAAKVLGRSVSGDYASLIDPVHRLLDDLDTRGVGAGGVALRRR